MLRSRTQGLISNTTVGSLDLRIDNPNSVAITVGAWNVPAFTTSLVTTSVGVAGSAGSSDSMTDIGGPKKLVFNQCDHTFNQFMADTVGYDTGWISTSVKSGVSAGKPCKIRVSGTHNAAEGLRLDQSVTDYLGIQSVLALKTIAEGQMKPGAPPIGFDLAQFIGELTDFSGLFKKTGQAMLSSKSDLLSRVADRISGKLRRAVEGKSFLQAGAIIYKHLLNVGVNSHLAWKLVYEPFYRDTKKLRDAILRYDTVLRQLQLPKTFRVYGTGVSQASALMDSGQIGRSYGYAGVQRRTVTTWALVRQKPLWSVLPGDFFRQYFGLAPRLSVAWELTPATFIVDMFVDIGAWLRQFDGSVYQIPFELLSSGYSTKNVFDVKGIARPSYQWANLFVGVNFPSVTGERIKRVYSRKVGGISFNPVASIQPLEFKLPNLGQLGTLAELVYVSLTR